MHRSALILAALAWAAPLSAQNTPPPATPDVTIHLPPEVGPAPAPSPIPGGATLLPADVLFIISSNSDFIVLASPDALVTVTRESGPLSLRAKFVEAPDKVVTRKVADKFIAIVESSGSRRCELIVVPVGVQKSSDIIRRLVDCGAAPQPPPVPPVPPQPVPPGPAPTPPSPAPIPGPGLHALFIYESSTISSLPPAQEAVLYAKSIRDYMRSKSIDFRVYDQDVDLTAEAQIWKDAIKRPRKSLPWLIVSDGTKGYEGALPANIADTLVLLKMFGGN